MFRLGSRLVSSFGFIDKTKTKNFLIEFTALLAVERYYLNYNSNADGLRIEKNCRTCKIIYIHPALVRIRGRPNFLQGFAEI